MVKGPIVTQKFTGLDREPEKESMKLQFSVWWNNLNTHVKSVIISILAIALAVVFFLTARAIFPSADFTVAEVAITTGISGFIVHLMTNVLSS